MSRALIRRRQLLFRLGGSAFLAVPVFRDSLSQAQTAAPLRLIIVTYPGGVRMPESSPPDYESGAFGFKPLNFDFNGILAGLAPLQSDLLFIEGVGNLAMAVDNGHVPQSVLTGDSRGQEEGASVPADITSIDQIIGKAIGAQTRFSSLQFGVTARDEHWSFYQGSPLNAVSEPAAMFTRLFGDGAPKPANPATPSTPADAQALAAVARLRALRQSSLDQFSREILAIKALTGSSEQQKLDLHLTSIRELEKSLPQSSGGGGIGAMPGLGCAVPSISSGSEIPALTASMNELLFQAVNCDLTRVATLQLWTSGHDTESLAFVPGVTSGRAHHAMQHEPDAEFDRVQTWIFSQIGALIQKLKNSPEGSGSMLDNSAVLVLSSMSDGRWHMGSPFLGFIAGKAGGKIQTGRTLQAGGVAMNDLYVSLANIMGVNITAMGEGKFNRAPLNLM